MRKHIYELQDLRPGTPFEVIGLENEYRKLTLVSLTAGAALIKGESSLDDKENDENGKSIRVWKILGAGTMFSLRTPVRLKTEEIKG